LLKESTDTFPLICFFEGKPKEDFKPKIKSSWSESKSTCHKDYHFTIDTQIRSHSSGIASSASGMAALAMNFMSLEKY
jgi:diphosphomevalonate decarboxylase